MTTEQKRRILRKRIREKRRQKWKKFLLSSFLIITTLFVLVLVLFVHGRKVASQNASLKDKLSVSMKQIEKLSKKLDNVQAEKQEAQEANKALEEENKELSSQVDLSQQNRAYLTFDDGPSKQTEEILDILKKYNVKATFFVTGKTEPELVPLYKRIVQEGHTLGMHTYSHDYDKIYKNMDAYKSDLQNISDYIYKTTGVRPVYYRFPGGSSNTVSKNLSTKECIRYLNEEGITYFDWNVENGDATGKSFTPSQLVSNVMKQLGEKKNAVILMHDANNKQNTVKSLPSLIEKLKSKKYTLLPINEYTPLVQHRAYDSVK